MKKLTTANWTAIVLFTIGQIIALFSQEQRLTAMQNLFIKMVLHWQLALFIVSTFGLTATIAWIIARNYIDSRVAVNEKLLNEVNDKLKIFIDTEPMNSLTKRYLSDHINAAYRQATHDEKEKLINYHYKIAVDKKLSEADLMRWGLDNEIILKLRKTDYQNKIKRLDDKINASPQKTINQIGQ